MMYWLNLIRDKSVRWVNSKIAGKELLVLIVGLTLFAMLTRNTALVIGGVTLYIAYQQYITNKMKLRLEVYQKKFDIYDKIKSFMIMVINNTPSDMQELLTFQKETAEADFMFGDEIRCFIDEVFSKSIDLWRCLQINPNHPEYNKCVVQEVALKEWFIVELNNLKSRFKKYLDLENI
jgi:hypothetical protein